MKTHPNADLVARFYEALSRRDGDAMAACYHPEVHFKDPVFDLRGPKAGAMWRMLCARGEGMTSQFSDVRAYDESGSAYWEATYVFSKTGRSVHNVIEATFVFKDGLIRSHRDTFDFWAWSRQALGAPGILLGWTPWLRAKVATEASKNLDAYIAQHPGALG